MKHITKLNLAIHNKMYAMFNRAADESLGQGPCGRIYEHIGERLYVRLTLRLSEFSQDVVKL